jgi:putative heme iron utilization protein
MAAEPRVALLFDGTAGLAEPLTGARATVLGRAERSADERLRARFLARHPGAALYAGFGDFHLYRVAVERAHLVAGFGRIDWIAAAELLPPGLAALAESEDDIVRHMNEDHEAAVALYARVLLGRQGEGWRLTGIDAEGIDLRRDGEVARLDFAAPVGDAQAARAALVRLAQEARAR